MLLLNLGVHYSRKMRYCAILMWTYLPVLIFDQRFSFPCFLNNSWTNSVIKILMQNLSFVKDELFFDGNRNKKKSSSDFFTFCFECIEKVITLFNIKYRQFYEIITFIPFLNVSALHWIYGKRTLLNNLITIS